MKTNLMKNELVAFVPCCLLAPIMQAEYGEKHLGWNKKILQILMDNNIHILQMPCPEATFNGLYMGLRRPCRGVSYYKQLDGFTEYCDELSEVVSFNIKELLETEKLGVIIIGIEHSPTCAASYMYTNNGTQKRQGLFIEKLTQRLDIRKYTIIGVNRRYPDKALRELERTMINLKET